MSNYGGIARFGNYTFTYVQSFSDNFATARVSHHVIAGMSGGFNNDGLYPPPSQLGRVNLEFMLVANDRADMETSRDAVKALYQSGLQKLVKQPTDSGDDERFCYAYVENIKIGEDKSKHTDLFQTVSISFIVPSPFWQATAYASFTLDDGKDLNDALTLGNGSRTVAASGILTTTTLTNNGNAPALVKLAITCGTGQTCAHPTIQRMKSAAIVDEIVYNGVMTAGQELFIDGARQFAHLDGSNIIGGLFEYKRIELMSLEPGANTIHIRFDNVSDAASVRFWFNHTWR